MKQAGLPSGDDKLVQIVDAAFADAARKSGPWLLCRAGCSQCCHGVFAIHQLDAERLRQGLAELGRGDPERAGRVRQRAIAAVEKLAKSPAMPRQGFWTKATRVKNSLKSSPTTIPALPSIQRPERATCTSGGR